MFRDRLAVLAAAMAFAATPAVAPRIALAQSRPIPLSGLIVAQAEVPKLFRGAGKIVAVDAPSGFVTISHEAIPGLMDAMTMQFEAKPAKLLEGYKGGDRVEFELDGKTYSLLAIGKAPELK